MAIAVPPRQRVVVDGKFFRLGEKKFFVKGVAYGPFAPNAHGLPFAFPEQTAADFTQIRELGANVVRVYDVPPRWLLDLAAERDLKIFIDVPWNKHLCFDTEQRRDEARQAVRRAVLACGGHPAVFAFSVANEIPPDVVRWHGAKAVADFIDELAGEARRIDPHCLCTYANFPPTEFLHPRTLDFVCFNLYLHDARSYRNYLSRLQMIADSKPLVLGEFGIDSLREGETRKCEILSWQIEGAFRAGLAGAVVFTFTDDWFRGGRTIDDWKMGLVSNHRERKESFLAVQRTFNKTPYFPLPHHPKVSIVVASYNGGPTLKACLDSLQRLNYPDYEVILVDDGSTDATPQIAKAAREHWPHNSATLSADAQTSAVPRSGACAEFISIRHEKNLGLSAARNTGIAAASGEIIAFIDSDCRADEDWLYFLVGELVGSEFAGVGGPNLLPPEDSRVAAAVMVSPGGPAHVMLTDRQAEHIPGCNMAFHRWVLDELGGFDPVFTKAGDDVDVCWRVQQAGCKIGFSPAAFVWHSRRSTVGAYLKQQRGYGEAEALLVRKHPENFNSFGGGIWRGRIYAPSRFSVAIRPSVIYHGLFGSAGFQKLYASQPATILMLCTTLEYHLFAVLPLWILSAILPHFIPLAIASVLVPIIVCVTAAAQAELPRNKTAWWSRPLVALLFFLQPIVRGWARYAGRLALHPPRLAAQESLDSIALLSGHRSLAEVRYWAERKIERVAFVAFVLQKLDQKQWPSRADLGWSEHDVEIYGSRWSRLQLTTVAEDHPGNKIMIRCRLHPARSLFAQINFWSLVGCELLAIGLTKSWWPWPWLVLLTLPGFVWFLLRDQRRLQSIAVVFLDQLAEELGLKKVELQAPAASTVPAER